MSALTLALPSKGRLQEQATEYLAQRGVKLRKISGARDYRAMLDKIPGVHVLLLPSGEIVRALYEGEVHLGITGADLIGEVAADSERKIAQVLPLGFGFADVVVAVPRAWLDVDAMSDLDDVCSAFHLRHHRRLKIATKYPTLTRGFLASHGIADYRIVESAGATEGAPAAGAAEAIVDITTTGATLAANDLKVLNDGVILKSQAQLAASLAATWDKTALAVFERLASFLSDKPARVAAKLRAALNP